MKNPFKKGDRVVMSAKGKEVIRGSANKNWRTGTVVYNPRGELVNIHWDGTKSTTYESLYHEFVAHTSEVKLPS